MLTSKQLNFSIAIWSVFIIFTFLSSCKDREKVTAYVAPSFSDQQSMFFLSWIAECTSDTAVIQDSLQGLQSLTALGSSQLAAAITNPILTTAFGNYGTAPVWGPALSVSVVGDTAVLTDNLLYAVLSEQEEEITYTIAVSGTNAISTFDWLEEDFNVKGTEPWVDPNGNTHGAISAGSALGLSILNNLEDQSNTNVLEYIVGELTNGDPTKNYTIAVTGHSLGGALSPLLALYLKERLSAVSLPVSYAVEAWPYAGPTPGDVNFADYLVSTLDAYHAFNNNFDLVPHAWELDSLERLCDLYVSDEAICGYSQSNASIVEGFAEWAIGLSDSSGVEYHIAGTPNTFDGNPLPINTMVCETIAIFADSITESKTNTTYEELKLILEFIDVQCGDKNPTDNLKDNIAYLLLYFRDVDYQHTTAYELKYFPDSLVMANVDAYFPAGIDDLAYLGGTLSALLPDILQYLQNNNITNCQCQ